MTFLELAPNARAVGMGEAYTALADDASALAWNPAGLSRIRQFSLHAMYHAYVEGVHYQYLAGGGNLPGLGTFGLQLVMLDSGDIPKTTEDNAGNLATANTIFWVTDFSLAGGWAAEWSPGVRVGFSAKWIQQTIDRLSRSGLAFDAGIQYEVSDTFRVGASYQHVGPAINAFALPATLRAGGAMLFLDRLLTLSADVVYAQGLLSLKGGAEYWADPLLAFRAGYQTGLGTGGLSGFHAGLGTVLERTVAFDYAFSPMGDLGNSHRASLSLNF